MTYNTVWLIMKYSLFIVKFLKIYILTGKGRFPGRAVCHIAFPSSAPGTYATWIMLSRYVLINPKWTGYHRVHHGPGWGKTRPHFWPIAADWWGLNYWEERRISQSTCPDQCGANGPLRKSERIGLTANPPSPALYATRDRKLIGMLTSGKGVGLAG
jgi:hypothetical protein